MMSESKNKKSWPIILEPLGLLLSTIDSKDIQSILNDAKDTEYCSKSDIFLCLLTKVQKLNYVNTDGTTVSKNMTSLSFLKRQKTLFDTN